jgi:FMN phosphatase YigB (HAD superfamily)
VAPGLKVIPVTHGGPGVGKVLKDLSFPDSLQPIVLSEEEGIEKPSKQIFMQAVELVNRELRAESIIRPEECLHIGDELIWFVL